MSRPRDERQKDLFRVPLDRIVDSEHPLVRLADRIDWPGLEHRFGGVFQSGPGHPPLPWRLMAGLLILKRLHNLSDKALAARWLENPYDQYFCGEASFRHTLPFDRSTLARWRRRLGEDALSELMREATSPMKDTPEAAKSARRAGLSETSRPAS